MPQLRFSPFTVSSNDRDAGWYKRRRAFFAVTAETYGQFVRTAGWTAKNVTPRPAGCREEREFLMLSNSLKVYMRVSNKRAGTLKSKFKNGGITYFSIWTFKWFPQLKIDYSRFCKIFTIVVYSRVQLRIAKIFDDISQTLLCSDLVFKVSR